MGQERRHYLAGHKVYGCKSCRTHLSTSENLMSKKFNGQNGQAFLFHTCLNVTLGQPEDRQMTTGLHTVRDLRCIRCAAYLGWKYDKAYEPSQKYKENHFILERKLLTDVTPLPPTSPSTSLSPTQLSTSPTTSFTSPPVRSMGGSNGNGTTSTTGGTHARGASTDSSVSGSSLSTDDDEDEDE